MTTEIPKPEPLFMRPAHLLIALFCILVSPVHAQEIGDTLSAKATRLTQKYIGAAKSKSERIGASIDKQTSKYLDKLQKTEARLAAKLAKLNKPGILEVLANSKNQYAAVAQKLSGNVPGNVKASGEYLPYIDSLKGSLSFLKDNKCIGRLFNGADGDVLNDALKEVNQVQGKLQNTEMIKQFIAERKRLIADALNHYTDLPNSIRRSFEAYNKQAYYYTAQVRDLKEMLNDPDKIEIKALSIINQLPAFQAFMKEHSELAGLFNIPGNYASQEALIGLQTKDQVQQLISNQMGGGPNVGQLFGQQIQSAKQGLDQFKDKLNRLGGGSGDIDMPNFKPNQQKTRPFLKRLEYGTNFQTQRSGYFFPTTTDLALSVGYKLSNKSIIGVGMSYKLGWGKDIQHIEFSSEGIGLRSFADFQVNKTFYASGGLEYNYQQPFNSFQQIKVINSWSQSGLIGISKIVSLKTKVFKKTKLQILWDFLSYQQRPVTQPFKFRVGYNF